MEITGITSIVPPSPEWNILNDVKSAQKLFASGVPVYVMPLDSTQLKLDEVKRAFLFYERDAGDRSAGDPVSHVGAGDADAV